MLALAAPTLAQKPPTGQGSHKLAGRLFMEQLTQVRAVASARAR